MTHDEETKNFLGDETNNEYFDSVHDEDDRDPEDSECYECGGDGWIVDDCFEDTCCCADPETDHDIIPCPVCNPNGRL